MQKPYTKVLIKDLELLMSIGIHEHEKAEKQRVIVNVELCTAEPKTDDIKHAVCYETMINQITELSQGTHYDLVEIFAEDIAKTCLKDTRVTGVKITAEKPDIIENAKAVGVEIYRA